MAKKLFTNAKTEAGLTAAVNAGTLNAHVAFLEEQGNEGIHAKGKTYQTIPSNGRDGQVLMASNSKGVWADLNLLDMVSYGVKWYPNVSDPTLIRVGNYTYHKTLPIQSNMKGCIYNPKEKRVVYWLDENDWRFKKHKHIVITTFSNDMNYPINEPATISSNDLTSVLLSVGIGDPDGTGSSLINDFFIKLNGIICKVVSNEYVTSSDNIASTTIIPISDNLNIPAGSVTVELGARLDGYDGEVMVYVPEFYIRSWDEEDRREVRISTVQIDDTWEHQPALFMGAYRDTVLNTVPEDMGYLSTLEANTAISVANNAAYCRGGNDNPANDALEDIFRRQLGKCRTNIQRATFRTYARNAGKEIMSYRQYKNIMYWLYVVEYANFNSQAPYNAELTVEGFHQGGLGIGLTNVNAPDWYEYTRYYPISPNGYTNELGNGTGTKLIAPLGPAPVGNVFATRWRGIENPFGDTFYNVDGIIIDADADNHPNNMNYVYTTDDPTKYGDTLADIANMVLSGLEVHTGGYTKEWDLGTTAEIIPRLMGGNTTEYKCDYHNIGRADTIPRTLILGSAANTRYENGLGGFNSFSNMNNFNADVGFRSVSVV